MQNVSQNEIKQIIKMQGLSRDKLEQIEKKVVLKNQKYVKRKVINLSFKIKKNHC